MLPSSDSTVVVEIPDVTIITINNITSNIVISNIGGGVEGRMVIFMCDSSFVGNSTIIFSGKNSVSGTGIYIPKTISQPISITAGQMISFIFLNGFWYYKS